ncbi:MAG: hypothetical protein K0S27_1639 [Gammaproteobacteria bacterium]|jgi:hypothetical protein|nr:hypothetical protein [Gammaproteobacteria bacterium]
MNTFTHLVLLRKLLKSEFIRNYEEYRKMLKFKCDCHVQLGNDG